MIDGLSLKNHLAIGPHLWKPLRPAGWFMLQAAKQLERPCQPGKALRGNQYNVGPPSYVCWFKNIHKPHQNFSSKCIYIHIILYIYIILYILYIIYNYIYYIIYIYYILYERL